MTSTASTSQVIYVPSSSSSENEDEPKTNPQENPQVMKQLKPGYCHLCYNNVIDQLFFPCRHASICTNCFNNLPLPKRCPICKQIITVNHVIYL